MKAKPRGTVKNQKALLYKRYTNIELSLTKKVAYKTFDNKLWIFDIESKFIELNGEITPTSIITVGVATILTYNGLFYHYITDEQGKNMWEETTEPSNSTDLLVAKFGNIAKYQLNKYYYADCFDYIIKGDISGTETQPIKGMITPLESFSIKFWNDYLNIDHDDLIVIENHLYSVENLTKTVKRQPNRYNIYFCDLNSIL